jgi:arylsulfatase A-like enzyme
MNTILILIDTLRRDHLGCYGNDWIISPHVDRLAREGVTFDNAYLGSYPCMPARRDIWTGRYEFPWRGWGPLEPDDIDIGSLLLKNDRTSMYITDHYHMWEKGSGNYFFDFSGTEFIRGQENDLWITDPTIPIHYPTDPKRLAGHAKPGSFERYSRNIAHFRTERDYFAPQVFQAATDWVERNRSHDGFFLLIDCFDPHEPFDPPYPFNELYNPGYEGDHITWPTYGWSDLSPDELKQLRALYAGELTMTDKWLGLFLDKVRELGLMDNTMIILTTDHGHMFGEHGLMGKPWSDLSDSNMYQELVHIPLIIYHPKQAEAGRRISSLVQPVDLFPTALEGLGLDVPAGTHGHSLLPFVLGSGPESPVRETACYARFGEAINITDGEWTLFLWPPGDANNPLNWYGRLPPQFGAVTVAGEYDGVRYPVQVARGEMLSALHDLNEDYQQQHNLYSRRPDVAERLTAELRAFLQSIDAPAEQLTRLGLEA